MTLFGLMGVNALYFLYLWLVSCICASYLSDRKGYGERPGLATGLCLSAVAVIIWLIVPPKPESKWKVVGAFGRGKSASEDQPAAS